MELGAKDFFMVISLLKLLQIYCTKHIIVVLVKPRTFSLHTKVLSDNKCTLESQYNSDFFFRPFKRQCCIFDCKAVPSLIETTSRRFEYTATLNRLEEGRSREVSS